MGAPIVFRSAGFLICVLLAGCATPPPASDPEALAEYRENHDPLEPTNRQLYKIHDLIDSHVTAPVARGYREYVPNPIRTHLADFVDNAASPARLGNDILQAKPRRAGDTLMRFLINSTIGVAGIFDPATGIGYPRHKTDFSITLALWGVGPGPFLFIPVVGPTETRALSDYPAGIALSPLTFVRLSGALQTVGYGRSATSAVDDRAGVLDTVENVKKTAVDPYATFRTLYQQHHASEIEATRADNRATVPVWFPRRGD